MTTTEEMIVGLLAAGHRVPRNFVRAGLYYEYQAHDEGGPHYLYGPCDPFEVGGIVYDMQRSEHAMSLVPMMSLFPDHACHPDYQCWPNVNARQDWRNPPTEAELDQWVRTAHWHDLHDKPTTTPERNTP